MFTDNTRSPVIISTVGSKGGTGKSTVIFSIIRLLLEKKDKKILIINTDESSCTLLLRVNEFNILEGENVIALDMSLDSLVEFYKKNRDLNFIPQFDYIVIDLKGSDVAPALMQDLIQIVNYFIIPCIPSRDGLPAFHGCLKAIATAKNNVQNSTISSEAVSFFRSAISTLGSGQSVKEVVELCLHVFEDKKKEIVGEDIALAKTISVLNLHGHKPSRLNEENIEVYRSIVANMGICKDFEIYNVEAMDDKKDLLLSKKDNKDVLSSMVEYMLVNKSSVEKE